MTGTCLSPWVTESTDVIWCVPESFRDVRRIGEIIMTAPSTGSRVQRCLLGVNEMTDHFKTLYIMVSDFIQGTPQGLIPVGYPGWLCDFML